MVGWGRVGHHGVGWVMKWMGHARVGWFMKGWGGWGIKDQGGNHKIRVKNIKEVKPHHV